MPLRSVKFERGMPGIAGAVDILGNVVDPLDVMTGIFRFLNKHLYKLPSLVSGQSYIKILRQSLSGSRPPN